MELIKQVAFHAQLSKSSQADIVLKEHGIQPIIVSFTTDPRDRVPCCSSSVIYLSGMPNVRKNPFSTDFYHLFQSTDKQMIYGRIYGFFLNPLKQVTK